MDREVRMRYQWILIYRQVRDACLVCRRCGISRPTLRKWLRGHVDEALAVLLQLAPQTRS